MVNILVTGANGQLGNELQKISDNYPGFRFHFTDIDSLDITNPEALSEIFRSNNFAYIVNCAAYTAVDRAETEPDLARLINTEAVKNLAREALKYKSKLIHISTDYVFDGNAFQPYTEVMKTNPQSVYGKTKLDGEKEALSYPESIVIRTSWLYSSFGNNFVKTILRIGRERKELKVVFDQVGNPTYAEDLAGAVLKIINFTEKKELIKGIYHYSNEGVCSWYDFAWEIINFSNIDCKVIPIESSEYPSITKRPFYSVLNKNKVKTVFNFEIPYWKTSLYRCLSELNK